MQQSAITIYCPNPTCQTANQETQKFCQKCRTPLPKRYLWAILSPINNIKPGELRAERYLFKTDQIVLDTKPGLLPTISEEIPQEITPYLRLFPQRLHIPQIYGQLPQKETNKPPIWLLEQAPIDSKKIHNIANETKQQTSHKNPKTINSQTLLYPPLSRAWKQASPMRQLHWLWQIAQLWEPLNKEGAASSLLNPNILRAQGQLIRLLQLQFQPSSPDLSQLGEIWLQLLNDTQPQIAPFLEKLSHSLIQNQIQTSNQLVEILDKALQRTSITQQRTYQLATRTDTGPTRRRNEDACYPNAGQDQKSPKDPLIIVCDGIGGHEGGNVASRCAIDAIRHRLTSLKSNITSYDPKSLITELETATCIANDEISDRNNDEQRLGRQRMGTTLVMALAKNHEVYITHVGDSRAYWISPTNCHQVTLDDDMATREVRLGYAFYRDAIEQPAAGSLVQALGMASSGMLHPSVTRFIIDESTIFLLCSDGLSDNDRVEECWDKEIPAVLKGEIDLSTAASRLIEIANRENGHDNVTVGLLYCSVKDNPDAGVISDLLISDLDDALETPENLYPGKDNQNPHPVNTLLSTASTQLLVSPNSKTRQHFKSPLPWLLTIALLLGIPVFSYFTLPPLREKINSLLGITPPTTIQPSFSGEKSLESVSINTLEAGAIIRVQLPNPGGDPTLPENLQLSAKPGPSETLGTVSTGSILKIIEKQTIDNVNWLNVQICLLHTTPNNSTPKTQSSPQNKPVSTTKKLVLTPNPVNTQSPAIPKNLIASTVKTEVDNSKETRPSIAPVSSPIGLNAGDTGWVREDSLLERIVKKSLNREDLSPESLGQCAESTP
jgi:protein phosphatase